MEKRGWRWTSSMWKNTVLDGAVLKILFEGDGGQHEETYREFLQEKEQKDVECCTKEELLEEVSPDGKAP